ncbi:MAG: hypothetical protein B6A08_08300 [Sorangiineae bacterium NIC37A_2]|jgi:hypothetical protein|nr:MAG: hypothetical protein B6A08_08300 [Sorangiineae bacterium NIC37A_2]
MVEYWPLALTLVTVLGAGSALLRVQGRLAALERGGVGETPTTDEEDAERDVVRMQTRLLPKALGRICHFAGAACGFVSLARAVGAGSSVAAGIGCFLVGSGAALAISAWGRPLEMRAGRLVSGARSEKRRGPSKL